MHNVFDIAHTCAHNNHLRHQQMCYVNDYDELCIVQSADSVTDIELNQRQWLKLMPVFAINVVTAYR